MLIKEHDASNSIDDNDAEMEVEKQNFSRVDQSVAVGEKRSENL